MRREPTAIKEYSYMSSCKMTPRDSVIKPCLVKINLSLDRLLDYPNSALAAMESYSRRYFPILSRCPSFFLHLSTLGSNKKKKMLKFTSRVKDYKR